MSPLPTNSRRDLLTSAGGIGVAATAGFTAVQSWDADEGKA